MIILSESDQNIPEMKCCWTSNWLPLESVLNEIWEDHIWWKTYISILAFHQFINASSLHQAESFHVCILLAEASETLIDHLTKAALKKCNLPWSGKLAGASDDFILGKWAGWMVGWLVGWLVGWGRNKWEQALCQWPTWAEHEQGH